MHANNREYIPYFQKTVNEVCHDTAAKQPFAACRGVQAYMLVPQQLPELSWSSDAWTMYSNSAQCFPTNF